MVRWWDHTYTLYSWQWPALERALKQRWLGEHAMDSLGSLLPYYLYVVAKCRCLPISVHPRRLIWLSVTDLDMLSHTNVFCTPGFLIQTSINEITGCSMRGEICQVCPNMPIYFLNRKVLWEFGGNGSMSSQLTESGGDDVLELRSRYTDNNLMPWWVNLAQIKLLLNADDEILEISK